MERTLEAFAARAGDAGLFLDFDGTLSDIVRLPGDARPVEGAAQILTELANVLSVVAIVSGRSAHQLLEWLGPDVEIWGLHGAQRSVDGQVVLSPEASQHEDRMRVVLEEARAAVREAGRDGVVVEDKGVVIGLHYRAANDRGSSGRWVKALAERLAEEHGVVVAPGRLVLELRAPVEFSKQTVVLRRIRETGLTAAAFAGDDVVDLPGFDALDMLEDQLEASLRIAVESEEAPPELLERADVVVPGPAGMMDLLRELVSLTGGR